MNYSYAMVIGHLKWIYECPYCGGEFKGNGFYRHEVACMRKKSITERIVPKYRHRDEKQTRWRNP